MALLAGSMLQPPQQVPLWCGRTCPEWFSSVGTQLLHLEEAHFYPLYLFIFHQVWYLLVMGEDRNADRPIDPQLPFPAHLPFDHNSFHQSDCQSPTAFFWHLWKSQYLYFFFFFNSSQQQGPGFKSRLRPFWVGFTWVFSGYSGFFTQSRSCECDGKWSSVSMR